MVLKITVTHEIIHNCHVKCRNFIETIFDYLFNIHLVSLELDVVTHPDNNGFFLSQHVLVRVSQETLENGDLHAQILSWGPLSKTSGKEQKK